MKKTKLAVALALMGCCGSLRAADWPSWRGADATGSSNDGPLPATWSPEGENLIWKAPYPCRSGPIVMDGRLYMIDVAGTGPTTQERVVCLDAATGKVVWEHRFNVFHTDIVTSRVGWANVCGDPETGYVYAHGVQGLFYCFDRDGKIVWQRSLTEEMGRISGYGGRTNSPIVDENLVIFSSLFSSWGALGKGSHRYLAFDKRTGRVVWWSSPAGRPLDTTYSVPVVTVVGGVRMLIAANADGAVYGLQARTGRMIWKFRLSGRGINASPVVDGYRVYVCHGEENIDGPALGRVVCIDARGQGDVTATHEVWRIDGLTAGYASPALHGGFLYVCDNAANLYKIDAENGRIVWKINYGTVAKGSPVWADGKIYVGEVGAKYQIIGDDPAKPGILNTTHFTSPNVPVVAVYGSPAVAGGRVYLSTAQATYCIGLPNGKGGPASEPPPKEPPSRGPATLLQMVPADVTIHPGESVRFELRAFDAIGRPFPLEIMMPPSWSLPAAPPPPTKGPMAGSARGRALQGEIKPDGTFTAAESVDWQAGLVMVKLGDLTAQARVRVVPRLPYKIDFEDLPENGGIPGVINAQASKARVRTIDGNKVLRKLADNAFPPFARMRAYLTPPIPAGYTIAADVMGTRKRRNWPDMGLINSRYLLILRGTTVPAKLQLTTWEVIQPAGRVGKLVDFDWKPGVWYRMKLRTDIVDGRGRIRGKVWPRDGTEPGPWTIELEDPVPNPAGSPGLYGYSTGITKTAGTEVFFDNVVVQRRP